MTRPLAKITPEAFAPVWLRHEIPSSRIAETLGVSRQAVSYLAKKFGLPPRTGNQKSKQKVDNETFRRMWMAGVSSVDMARHFGYAGSGSIVARRRLLKLPPRTRRAGNCARGGWYETISLTEFAEMELARRMKEG